MGGERAITTAVGEGGSERPCEGLWCGSARARGMWRGERGVARRRWRWGAVCRGGGVGGEGRVEAQSAPLNPSPPTPPPHATHARHHRHHRHPKPPSTSALPPRRQRLKELAAAPPRDARAPSPQAVAAERRQPRRAAVGAPAHLVMGRRAYRDLGRLRRDARAGARCVAAGGWGRRVRHAASRSVGCERISNRGHSVQLLSRLRAWDSQPRGPLRSRVRFCVCRAPRAAPALA